MTDMMKFSIEDDGQIRNAPDRVVVVAAKFALDEYLKYSAYICLPHRSFRECIRMAFYTKNAINRHIPKILGKVEAISRDEIETRTDLSDIDREKLHTLVKKMDIERSEEWSQEQLKIIFLTTPDSLDTLILPHDIINNSQAKSGQGTAYTQQQRYVSLARLEKGPKTTSELV